jgi:hypothetical protein
MDIFDNIQEQLKVADRTTIIQQLDYHSNRKGGKALETFLSYDNLYEWLINSGFFDFTYSSEELFCALCHIFAIDPATVDKEISATQILRKEIDRCRGAYIFIDTNFRRRSQPIFSLAVMEFKRRIYLKPESLIYKNMDQLLSMITKIIIKHYAGTDGTLPMWGKIAHYQYNHYDGTIYLFDITGELIPDSIVAESRATLSI